MTDCIFCKIIAKEIPSEVVFEDDRVLAFKDINPIAPVHILIIPKKHMNSLDNIEFEDENLIGHLLLTVKKLAQQLNISETGYRVVTNVGQDGGQIVPHLHFHLIGGQMLGSKIG